MGASLSLLRSSRLPQRRALSLSRSSRPLRQPLGVDEAVSSASREREREVSRRRRAEAKRERAVFFSSLAARFRGALNAPFLPSAWLVVFVRFRRFRIARTLSGSMSGDSGRGDKRRKGEEAEEEEAARERGKGFLREEERKLLSRYEE